MAEERIPLDVTQHKAEELPSHMQKHLDLRGGPYATPMTPFSPYEGGQGSSSPFARVDSMGTGLDGLSSVSFCPSLYRRASLYYSKQSPSGEVLPTV